MTDTPGWGPPGSPPPGGGGPPQQPPGWQQGPPQGPPPGWQQPQGPPPGWQQPQGPPPGWQGQPQGPPPGSQQPQGPPPGWQGQPQGPPPGWQQPGPPPQQPGYPPPGWQQPPGPLPGGYGPPGWSPRPPAPKPGVVPLRPLGVGEILDGAISYIRAHPKVTLGLAAVIVTITQLFLVPSQYVLFGNLTELADPAGPVPSPADVAGAVGVGAGGALLSLAISFVGATILTGLLMIVVNQSVLGRPSSLGGTWAAAKSRLPGLLGLSLLVGLIVFAVALVCAIPVAVAGLAGAPVGVTVALGVLGGLAALALIVYLYVALALASPVYMLERTGVVAALSRSRRLVGPQWWRIFGILLLAALITAVLAAIISFPFSLAGGFSGLMTGQGPTAAPSLLSLVLGAIGTIIASTITTPFAAGVTGLLYIDQRMRREALDLELARATANPYPQPGYPHPGAPPPPQW